MVSEKVRVAQMADVPEGDTLRVRADDRWICLYKVDGEIFATADECSHAVASLSKGCLHGHVIECPMHGATFDVRTGRNLTFPAVVPVKSYPVVVDGDEVFIEV